MDSLQIFILSIVQGFTEFLPISSSAHLVLLPQLIGWNDQGLVFDVALHFGSLFAVLYYFRNEVGRMLKSWTRSICGGEPDQDSLLAWWVIVGTLPAIFAGFLLQGSIEQQLREPWILATASIVFGLLLWFADATADRSRNEFQLGLKDVLIIGCCQVLALIPGTSRSGITITLGLFLGLTRQAAARFSFLLAMPVIFASGVLQTVRMFTEVNPIGWFELLLGVVLSALSAALCIHYFLRLVERLGMLPFVVYRVLLGLAIFALLI
ncbi:MAG: Undecaprenyl-diphosphatase (EC 3.6.1.27) [Olavius algarvensis Gamma 3 endosymbiont]|nr:MAG: Undecaprenyl-diphosphatase (EC 3.6.1.27) [Olavius algarvensis Gamma 3 endosymbiont]